MKEESENLVEEALAHCGPDAHLSDGTPIDHKTTNPKIAKRKTDNLLKERP